GVRDGASTDSGSNSAAPLSIGRGSKRRRSVVASALDKWGVLCRSCTRKRVGNEALAVLRRAGEAAVRRFQNRGGRLEGRRGHSKQDRRGPPGGCDDQRDRSP